MVLEQLIQKKDYDFIEFRALCPPRITGDILYGFGYSKDGVFHSLDGDGYEDELSMEPISYNEWDNPKKNVQNGLTLIYDLSKTYKNNT